MGSCEVQTRAWLVVLRSVVAALCGLRAQCGLAGGLLVLAPACDGGESEAQARALLAAIAELDAESEPAVRTGRLAILSRLQLDDSATTSTRDVCLEAHLSLLEAERNQTQAQALIVQARGSDEGHGQDTRDTREVRDALARRAQEFVRVAEGNVVQGNRSLSLCKTRTRALAKRLATGP